MTDISPRQVDETSVSSGWSPVEAVQWTGENMGEVLAFATHGKSCVNSFGDPCVEVGAQFQPVEIGHWVIRDQRGWLHVCSNDVLLVVRTVEEHAQVLADRIASLIAECNTKGWISTCEVRELLGQPCSGEAVEPALETLSKADIDSIYAIVDAPYREGIHAPLADDATEESNILAYVVRDPDTGAETGYPPEAVRIVFEERGGG